VQVQEVAKLEDHKAEVWRVEWNLTGTVLASSGDDGSVRLWKANLSVRKRFLLLFLFLFTSYALCYEAFRTLCALSFHSKSKLHCKRCLLKHSACRVNGSRFLSSAVPARTTRLAISQCCLLFFCISALCAIGLSYVLRSGTHVLFLRVNETNVLAFAM
jgi:WD40 repeat protein